MLMSVYSLQLHRDELRRRFVKAEVSLFRIRYEELDREEQKSFLESRNFGLTLVRDYAKALGQPLRNPPNSLVRRKSRIRHSWMTFGL